MGWNVTDVATEEKHFFEKAISRDADTYVVVATATPRVNRAIEQFLASTTYTYAGEGGQELRSEWTKNFEQLKFVAAEATYLESNFEGRKSKPLFPKRNRISDKLPGNEFETAWSELRPPNLTDEWFAFFLKTNPDWFRRLQDFWISKKWIARWLKDWDPPEDLGEDDVDYEPM